MDKHKHYNKERKSGWLYYMQEEPIDENGGEGLTPSPKAGVPKEPLVKEAEVTTTSNRANVPYGPSKSSIAARVTPDRSSHNFFQRLPAMYWHHKRWSLPITVLLLVVVSAIVPWSRYALAGLVIKQNFVVQVDDATTGTPVSDAAITSGRLLANTNSQGDATLHISVGTRSLTISKKYYKTSSITVLVPLSKQRSMRHIQLQAVGRQVPITVVNKLTGKPVANALVRIADVEATTDQNGQVTVVLPANTQQLSARFSASGYNDSNGQVLVTADKVPQNTFQLTPTGKVYFLSNLSGTINVVKSDLDGSERQIVLTGTGNESADNTVLLASPDWKYVALIASRQQAGQQQLYLIDTTSNDKLTLIDSSPADFIPVGWSGDTFVYIVSRHGIQSWQPAGQILKAYQSLSGTQTTLDQTAGEGSSAADYDNTSFSAVYLVGSEVVYSQNWNASQASLLTNKNVTLFSIKPDGTGKQDIKDFPVPSQSYFVLALVQYAPESLYVQVPNAGGTNTYYSFTNNQLSSASVSDSTFYNLQRVTYFMSPDSQHTFWSEQRDGKNTLFVADASGKNQNTIASLSDYAAFGWFSNDYLLVSKNKSELYVMPVSGGTALKITDYYQSPSYGYGVM